MAKRRKPVEVRSTISGMISDAFSAMEDLKTELEEWKDNMPQSLQSGDKYNTLEESVNTIDGVSEPDVEDEVGSVECVLITMPSRRTGRAHRRDEAVAMLQAAKDKLESLQEDAKDDDDAEVDHSSLIEELDNAISEFKNVEFPGLYG